MKKMLPNMIFWLFIVLVLLWSVYYIISMTDYAGMSLDSDRDFEKMLPAKSASTLQDFKYAKTYTNRFGKSVVYNIEYYDGLFGIGNLTRYHFNFWGDYVLTIINGSNQTQKASLRCYDERFTNTTKWGFMQIKPGMRVGDVVNLVGTPIRTEETANMKYSYYETKYGEEYRILWEIGPENDTNASDYQRSRTIVGGRGVSYRDENGQWQQLKSLPIQPYITLAVGFVTALIILLRLKKKGILCKKKQSTE